MALMMLLNEKAYSVPIAAVPRKNSQMSTKLITYEYLRGADNTRKCYNKITNNVIGL